MKSVLADFMEGKKSMTQAKSGNRAGNGKKTLTLALFYCQNVPDSGEGDRQALEKKHGSSLRLFPIPCSGRLDPIHLLRALEEFADAAYVIACPEGACRYFEGNARAQKRLDRTRETIAQIGLERERLGMVVNTKDNPRGLGSIAGEILDRISSLPPSPVFGKRKVAKERRS
jgi:F420-non-reducing hydrogenase iron-sulfur subunit